MHYVQGNLGDSVGREGQLQQCKISYKVDMVGNVGISYREQYHSKCLEKEKIIEVPSSIKLY